MGPEGAAAPADRPLLMASTIGPVEVGLVDALVGAYRTGDRPVGPLHRRGQRPGPRPGPGRAGGPRLVHAPELEAKFLAEGYGTGRHPLAQNDFVICGPAATRPASASRRICR